MSFSPEAFKDYLRPLLIATAVVVLATIATRRRYPTPPRGNKAVVVVSGASTGIGRHAAEYLAKAGFTVLAGVRKEADAKSLKDQAIPTLIPVMLDVTKSESIKKVVEQAVATGLPIWGIVNNAGLGYPIPVELAKLDKASAVFQVNVLAVIAMVQQFVPHLRKSKGRVVNIGSATGTLAIQSDGIYAASKHAVEGLTDSLRLELGHWGMSVSLVIPGQVASDMWNKLTGTNSPYRTELSSEQYDLYKHLFEHTDMVVSQFLSKLSPPTVTSEAIYHALTATYPKTRYPVAGLNGIPLWLIRGIVPLFPDRIVDFVKLSL